MTIEWYKDTKKEIIQEICDRLEERHKREMDGLHGLVDGIREKYTNALILVGLGASLVGVGSGILIGNNSKKYIDGKLEEKVQSEVLQKKMQEILGDGRSLKMNQQIYEENEQKIGEYIERNE